jgi:hypothetical protein
VSLAYNLLHIATVQRGYRSIPMSLVDDFVAYRKRYGKGTEYAYVPT